MPDPAGALTQSDKLLKAGGFIHVTQTFRTDYKLSKYLYKGAWASISCGETSYKYVLCDDRRLWQHWLRMRITSTQ